MMVNKKGRFYTKHIIEKSLRHHVLEWIASIFTILGSILISNTLISGFYVLGIGNLLWMSFSWKHKHFGLLGMNIILLFINIFGIINWM